MQCMMNAVGTVPSEICKTAILHFVNLYSSLIHTYIRTYIHTYVRTYIHTYIRTFVCAVVGLFVLLNG